MQTEGWLIETSVEKVIMSYEIRICDIDKQPFNKDGWIQLPVPKTMDYTKLGLQYCETRYDSLGILDV